MLTSSLRRYREFAIDNGYLPVFPIQVEPLVKFLENLKLSNQPTSLKIHYNGLRHYPDHDKEWFETVFLHPRVTEVVGVDATKMRFYAEKCRTAQSTRIGRHTLHQKLPKNYNMWLDKKLTHKQLMAVKQKYKAETRKASKTPGHPSTSDCTLYISILNEL